MVELIAAAFYVDNDNEQQDDNGHKKLYLNMPGLSPIFDSPIRLSVDWRGRDHGFHCRIQSGK